MVRILYRAKGSHQQQKVVLAENEISKNIVRWVHTCWFYYCNSLLRVGQWRGHTGAGSWLVIQCVCKLWDENHCEPLIYGKGAKRVLLPYACKRRQKQEQNDVLVLFKLRLSSYPLRRCSTSERCEQMACADLFWRSSKTSAPQRLRAW